LKANSALMLGVERIGLLVLHAPVLTVVTMIVLAGIAMLGLVQLRVDDALKDLLRSDTEEFRTYEKLGDLFPTDELDVVAIATMPKPFSSEQLADLREFHLDLGLADGVYNVISMYSIHRPVTGNGTGDEAGEAVPVIPDELPTGEAFDALNERLAGDDLIANRFLARLPSGETQALLVIELDPDSVDESSVEAVVTGLQAEIDDLIAGTDIRIGLTGAPVMKTEILAASRRDSRFFNMAGFVIGLVISFGFFQNWRYVVVVLVPTSLAIICSLGLLGYAGIRLNPLMNTIIPLIMVIGFTNALHLVFDIRRSLDDGKPVDEAVRYAVSTVAPACVLSAITTAIAFASLMLADSHLIRVFGGAAAAATTVSLVSVTIGVPCLSLMLLRAGDTSPKASVLPRFSSGLDLLCRWFSRVILRHYRPIAILSILLIVGFTYVHLQLQPRYRISDIIPERGQAGDVARDLDRNFTGLNPVHVLISWPTDLETVEGDVFPIVTAVHDLLDAHPDLTNTRSIAAIRRSMHGSGSDLALAEFLDDLPETLAGRYMGADGRTTLVSANARDLEADAINAMRADIEVGLQSLRAEHPDLGFAVTGLATVSAARALDTIINLNRALLVAIGIVLIVVGLLFRSVQVAVLGLFANVFAVVATGSWLFVNDIGLQYVSVVGLTVAFGLAVDDTVHFLNRYWLERHRGLAIARAVAQSVERIGPVLILTTIIIVFGLAATLTSDVPPTRTFGALCMATLCFALIGDVVILPAIILLAQDIKRKLFGLKDDDADTIESENRPIAPPSPPIEDRAQS